MIVSHHLQQRHGRRDLRQGRIAQAATAARWTIGLSLKAAQRFCVTLPLIYHYEVAVRSSICGAKILKLPCLLRVMNRQNPMPSHVRLASDSGPMTDIGRAQFRASFRQSASQQTSALFHHLVGIIRVLDSVVLNDAPAPGRQKFGAKSVFHATLAACAPRAFRPRYSFATVALARRRVRWAGMSGMVSDQPYLR